MAENKQDSVENQFITNSDSVKFDDRSLKAINKQIDSAVGEKEKGVYKWIVGVGFGLILAVFGGAIYTISGEVKLLVGSLQANVFLHTMNRVDSLEKRNEALKDSLHKVEIERLRNELIIYKSKK